MSDKMYPIPADRLFTRIINEYTTTKTIFGIHEKDFYKPANNNYSPSSYMTDNIIGPASGPHTQMSQNIICSYLTGGRYIELKTVQILDQLAIEKPCIDATDECYNTEWSQELRLDESYEEYVKAWVFIHFLKNLLGLSGSKSGFVFNMSVGYNLEGIKSESIDNFINGMMNTDAENVFNSIINKLDLLCSIEFNKNILKNINPDFDYKNSLAEIPTSITDSVTLSTMHGCPPDEIEAIASHLMSKKKLNTYIKLNPTLLGIDFVNKTISDLAYNYISVGKDVFDKDLTMDEAIPMVSRLSRIGEVNEREFGIKLSNTLPVKNAKPKLAAGEMYMSGRSLFPLTINLTKEICERSDYNLNISFSGGANSLNIKDLMLCGFRSVTMATELLKPGGFLRLKQIAELSDMVKHPVSLEREKIIELAKLSTTTDYYKKDTRTIESIKIPKSLPLLDCYIAPCQTACPIHQDVPEYIARLKQGDYKEALKIIIDKNPLPHITGYICDHQCMAHCTRWDYETPVLIRDLKKIAALKGYDDLVKEYEFPTPNEDASKIAIIGAGPAGLSAAYFLARAGLDVTIFEKENSAGGVVKNIIPRFRLPEEAIIRDIRFIEKHGVRFVFGFDPDVSIEALQAEGYHYIVLAIGAEIPNTINFLKHEGSIINALDFLRRYHFINEEIDLGSNVAVIGGGNSAMDSARAAMRCAKVENVYLIYRRTKDYMPADKEEFFAALKDGVHFEELLQPVSFINGELKCQCMKLDEIDDDGRRKAKPIDDEYTYFQIDTIISAVGEHTDYELLASNNIKRINKKTFMNEQTLETTMENIFVCGDAGNGPATVVEAIADARKVTDEIIRRAGTNVKQYNIELDNLDSQVISDKGYIKQSSVDDVSEEAGRCLLCSFECNKCVDVCPNRANVAVKINTSGLKDKYQILHLDDLCNECGNCETFCPYQGKPYRDKLTYFSSENEYLKSINPGFYFIDDENIKLRINGEEHFFAIGSDSLNDNKFISRKVINQIIQNFRYLLR